MQRLVSDETPVKGDMDISAQTVEDYAANFFFYTSDLGNIMTVSMIQEKYQKMIKDAVSGIFKGFGDQLITKVVFKI